MGILKNKFFYLFLSAAIVLFLGFRLFTKNKGSEIKIDSKKAKTVVVRRGNLEKNLLFAGKVDASEYTVLSFQTAGMLSWIGVKEGDQVKKFQTLASLDKESLKKSFQKEMNDYLTSRWNFEDTQDQYKTTRDKYLVTPEIQRILDRQQFTLNNSVLDLEIADIVLKYASLRTPIEGVVTAITYPNSGVNILPTNFSITVVNPKSLYFKSEVDEEDVPLITEGQPAEITIDSFPEQKFSSLISQIAFVPVEGQTSTVYRVKFTLNDNNDKLKYRLGMNGDARVKLSESVDVLILPIEAVYEENGEKFIYLKNSKGKITKKIVKTGLENDEYIEIKDGIEEGALVIYNS